MWVGVCFRGGDKSMRLSWRDTKEAQLLDMKKAQLFGFEVFTDGEDVFREVAEG